MKKGYANLLLVIVTIIWGGGFLAMDGALDTFSPFYIMMIRFLGASILPLLLSWRKLRVLRREQLWHGLVAGGFLFLAFAFQTFGLQYSTPSKNAFLTATNVVFVPYLLWVLYRRRPKGKEIFTSILCLAGIFLLTWKPDSSGFGIGDGLSVVCAVFFALHIIVLERYSQHTDAICMTALQMLGAGCISTVCALVFEQPPQQVSIMAFGSILYLIFVSTLLAYLLQTLAQKYTNANSASLILSMEALFASLFSFLLLHEIMSMTMIFGACMIFGSVLFLEYHPKKKQNFNE